MYYSSGNYEAFARPRKPAGVDGKRAWFVGSGLASLAGAAFLVLLPVFLKNVLVGGFGWPTDLAAHIGLMIVGALIVFFLIVEPHGLAQLWRLTKEKLRLWPFPH